MEGPPRTSIGTPSVRVGLRVFFAHVDTEALAPGWTRENIGGSAALVSTLELRVLRR